MKIEKIVPFMTLVGVLHNLFIPMLSEGFDDQAHIILSRRATQISTLDGFLSTQLRHEFFNGVNEIVLNGKPVIQLIEDGAVNEDRPILWRPRHHFHNPRLAWDQAGWRPPPFSIQLGDSSVIWSQEPNQIVGGRHSWDDTRDTYYHALTATSDSDRKRLYGETFQSLGHLIHLVQDAAVPSHTRNDTHLSFKGIGDPDGFHGWADSDQGVSMIVAANSTVFDISVLNQPSPDAQAPVSISRLIDSTAGDIGLLALSPGLNIGIAEYSSANFFSDDTVNSPNFLSPRSSQIETRLEPDATGTTLRPYVYFRPGFGEQDYPLALTSAMLPYVIDPIATPTANGLDAKVFQGYGAKLFPRAIGYSAGLIDYFFRGKIDSTPWPELYLWVPWEQRPSSIRVDNVSVNVDGTNEQGGQGTMRLVLLFSYRYGGASDNFPRVVVSQEVPVNASSSPQTIVFPFDSLPFPTTFPAISGSHGYVYYGLLAYKGALGQESQAVVADSYCINPSDGARYDRWYVFEHGPALDGKPTESAYMSEC